MENNVEMKSVTRKEKWQDFKKRFRKFNRKENLHAWLYLAPSLVLLLIFTFYPIVNTFRISFLEEYHQLTGDFVGININNFLKIFEYEPFWDSVINTFVIVFVSVPLTIVISLIIAVALNSIKPLQNFYQTVFFLPYVTNVIAVGLVFSTIFDFDAGIVNAMFRAVGAEPVNWVNQMATVGSGRVVIILNSIWSGLAFKILIFLGGLQSIGKQYYDAAKVDGTPRKRVFTRITVPLLSPMILYVTITSFIGAFKTYSSIVAIFGTGPAARKHGTIVWFIYDFMSRPDRFGVAAAACLILFFIILFFTLVNLRVSKSRVHY